MSDDAPSLVVVRVVAAALGEVWQAFTDPALLQQWLAPGSCRVDQAEADARKGGSYRLVVVDPTGGRHVTSGEYLEVVPNERLVQTWVYQGEHAPDPYPTLLTVELRALGPASTEIRLRQDRLLTPYDREGNREGWRLCLDKLEALLRR